MVNYNFENHKIVRHRQVAKHFMFLATLSGDLIRVKGQADLYV